MLQFMMVYNLMYVAQSAYYCYQYYYYSCIFSNHFTLVMVMVHPESFPGILGVNLLDHD